MRKIRYFGLSRQEVDKAWQCWKDGDTLSHVCNVPTGIPSPFAALLIDEDLSANLIASF